MDVLTDGWIARMNAKVTQDQSTDGWRDGWMNEWTNEQIT